MMTVQDFVASLDRFAPPGTAAEWDNVGLLVGDRRAACDRVMTCLTLTDDVAEEAIRERCQLIIAHHPLPFKAIKRLTDATAEGRILLSLIQNRIAVYSPHTAFDNCPGGINDGLAHRLGLTNIRSLRLTPTTGSFKLTVFVPEGDLAQVADAVFAAGAGRIGINDKYTECSFRSLGTGTFHGGADAKPAVGQKGRREDVAEYRFETIVPEAKLAAVVAAMIQAHRYEEPAYDLYPVSVFPHWGQGRIGELSKPMLLRDLAALAKTTLRANGIQCIGLEDRWIRTVAIACGAAGEYLNDAIRAPADCFVTGELRFHEALLARSSGITGIVTGHFASERPGIEDLAVRLQSEFPAATVWANRCETDPVVSL
jgi:dinuclear metal center YbgI/SA1388 family protein